MQIQRQNKKRTIAAWLLLACLASVSAGCGAGSATPTPTTQTPTAAPIETAASAPTSTTEPQPAPTDTPQAQSNQWKPVGGIVDSIQDLAIGREGGPVLATGPSSVWLSWSDDYETWRQFDLLITGGTTSAAVGGKDAMYVASHSGCASGLPMSLQHTIDSGSTWEEVTSPALPLQVAAVDDSLAYGVSCEGVVRSTDSGITWSVLPGSTVENFDPQSLVASPDGQTLYVSYVSEGGTVRIQRSTNSGGTWSDVTLKSDAETERPFIRNLTYLPGPGSSSGLYVTKAHELWLLPLSSSDWKLIYSLEPYMDYTSLALDITQKSELAAIYASIASATDPELNGMGVFYSTDGGAAWEQVGDDLGNSSVRRLLLTPSGVLLAALNSGVWAIQVSP